MDEPPKHIGSVLLKWKRRPIKSAAPRPMIEADANHTNTTGLRILRPKHGFVIPHKAVFTLDPHITLVNTLIFSDHTRRTFRPCFC